MKKRIGNDIPIEIEVTRNGQPEDFSYVTTLSVVLKSCFGATLPFEYIVEGNVIKGVFWGKDQHQTGSYLIELVENNGIKGMASLDAELITLVDHTYKESDVDETGLNVNFDIVPEGVSMGATITAAKNGLSAYELAVLDGFVGTLSEWLESLHGRDGVDGVDGKDGKDGKDGEDGSVGPVGPKGEDGFSPRVSTISLEGGVALNIIDKDGSHLFRVYNGKDGNKGDTGPQGPAGPSYDDTEIRGLISGKVDKVPGKGLSTNDFTNEEKLKLLYLKNYDETMLVNIINAHVEHATDEDILELLKPSDFNEDFNKDFGSNE